MSLNPRLVGQVFRRKVNTHTNAHRSLNPRLVGQVFRHHKTGQYAKIQIMS